MSAISRPTHGRHVSVGHKVYFYHRQQSSPEKQLQLRPYDTHKYTEPNETTNNPAPVTTMTTVYPTSKGTSETIAWILQPYDICEAHKLITTLQHILTNIKDKGQPCNRQGNVLTARLLPVHVHVYWGAGRNLNTILTDTNKPPRMVISGITLLNIAE